MRLRHIHIIGFSLLLLSSGGCLTPVDADKCREDGWCKPGYICSEQPWHGERYCIQSGEVVPVDAVAPDRPRLDGGPSDADGLKAPLDAAPDRSVDAHVGAEFGAGPIDMGFVIDAPDACVVRPEACNNIDDDCDDATDEELVRPCQDEFPYRDVLGPDCATAQACVDGNWTACTFMLDRSVPDEAGEACNGKDDDCDGTVDEDATVECYEGPDGEMLGGQQRIGQCMPGSLACSSFSLAEAPGEAVVPPNQSCLGAIGPADAEACNDGIPDANCNDVVDDRCTCSHAELIDDFVLGENLWREVDTHESFDALGASCHDLDPAEEVHGQVREARGEDEAEVWPEKVFYFVPPLGGIYDFILADGHDVWDGDNHPLVDVSEPRRDPVLSLRTDCMKSAPNSEFACSDDARIEGLSTTNSAVSVCLGPNQVDNGIYIIAQGYEPGYSQTPMYLTFWWRGPCQ